MLIFGKFRERQKERASYFLENLEDKEKEERGERELELEKGERDADKQGEMKT